MSLPLLFTLPPSSRHELLLVPLSPTPSLKSLNALITRTMGASPNCAEFMGKYKAKPGEGEAPETINEMRIHWDTKSKDAKMWPEYTIVTEENLGAIVELLKINPVMGVLEVKVGKQE